MRILSRPVRRRSSVVAALLVWVVAAFGACAKDATDESVDRNGADAGWLRTEGNRIRRADGTPWMGRGVNLSDTRGCNACAYNAPNVAEVKRRIDEVVDVWGANFLRLVMESYSRSDGRAHWLNALEDPEYLSHLREIVAHVGTKQDVYVLLSVWVDPSLDSNGWPTAETARLWRRLAETFQDVPRVMFGVANEPKSNFNGSRDPEVWSAMNYVVAAIRAVEDGGGKPRHIVAVQGTRQWARVLDYYAIRPIEAGNGENVVYETHVYDHAADFDARFGIPSSTLPVIIGEFGPAGGGATMSMDDCARLMKRADELGVPYLAWIYHMRCPPNLLVDSSNGGCGVDMPLTPTEWGRLVRDHLSRFK